MKKNNIMTENKPIIIDGVYVNKCERHCMDNYNTPNRCYSDMTESYSACRPKENQCNFYIESIEQQLARKTQECETLSSQLDFEVQKKECLEQECEQKEKDIKYLTKCLDNSFKTQQYSELYWEREKKKLKAEKESYKQMLDNPEVRVALTDIMSGERDLWQKYKPRMEQAEQKLERIREITEPYKMVINKICGNCKKYNSCNACCSKDINCYKYTSYKTKACEEFTYLNDFVPNIISNKILQIIDEEE